MNKTPFPKQNHQNASSKLQPAVVLDLGGTWIKGCLADRPKKVWRWSNPSRQLDSAEEFAAHLKACCLEISDSVQPSTVIISTAGEVLPSGRAYAASAHHLGVMGTEDWLNPLEAGLDCRCTLLNDAEAFLLGVAVRGLLPLDASCAAIVVGTGIGFAISRHGRLWKPAGKLALLGSAWVNDETLDSHCSATHASTEAGGNLARLFSDPNLTIARTAYITRLRRLLASATALYRLDAIRLGGGLVDAATTAEFDLEAEFLPEHLAPLLPLGVSPPEVRTVPKANATTLMGAARLAQGTTWAENARFTGRFDDLKTESPGWSEAIEELPPEDIVYRLLEAESWAAVRALTHAREVSKVAARIAQSIRDGGRVIYVGAGTSGRLGALDAVEIPCTFGMAPTQFVALISGGVADSALLIESDNAEDTSSVADLLLLGPGPYDIVIGITASGTAYYVRSALAYAKACGATTVLLHENSLEKSGLADFSLRLDSGSEMIAGSTRLKAGTATKRLLNTLSTTAMVLLGKYRQGCMTDVMCCNEKLRRRAVRALGSLTGLDETQAEHVLVKHNYILRDALENFARAPVSREPANQH